MATIAVNPVDLARILGKLEALRTFGERVAVQELNRTAQQIRTISTQRVKVELATLKTSTIRNRFELEKATKSRPEAGVVVSHRPINLARFGARQTKRGVAVRVKRGRKVIPHAFIITARFGSGENEGTTDLVVWRPKGVPPRKRRGREPGLPVKALFSSSVRDVFQNHRDAVLAEEGGRLLGNLSRRLNSELLARSAPGI